MTDGEGCLCASGKSRKRHSIGQKYRPLCDLLLRCYGGFIHHNPVLDNWQWIIRNFADDYLKVIYPYLICKKNQADLILNMKPGEAPKIFTQLRNLKANRVVALKKIEEDSSEERAHTSDLYQSPVKQLPMGVMYNLFFFFFFFGFPAGRRVGIPPEVGFRPEPHHRRGSEDTSKLTGLCSRPPPFVMQKRHIKNRHNANRTGIYGDFLCVVH